MSHCSNCSCSCHYTNWIVFKKWCGFLREKHGFKNRERLRRWKRELQYLEHI